MASENAVATARRRETARQFQSQGEPEQSLSFAGYESAGFYDEMFDEAGEPRADCRPLFHRIQAMPPDDLVRRQRAADRSMVQLGITFNVYGDRHGPERIIPFDIIPRIVCRDEWAVLERGLRQRITALNMLIDDLYHEQRIVREGVLPEHVVATAKGFRKQCVGLNPAARSVVPHHGHRSGAGHRRPVLRAGRQSPLPVGRLVRAAEPAAHEADVSAVLRCSRDSTGG